MPYLSNVLCLSRRSIRNTAEHITQSVALQATATEGWVFPSKRAESAHLTTMAKRFREARVKAGLPSDLVLYCGRHDYGTRILKRTGNLAAVMRTMGHRDVKTAMQYQHPELEIVRAALDQDTTVEKRA
jgi:integrase